jgi:pimeloyl-ACP methyl ester carboxylesterase
MTTRDKAIAIKVDQEHLTGTVVRPTTLVPGVLLVHGWGGTQEQYLARARQIAALGCVCLTFDLRGHGGSDQQQDTVTREDNLRDVIAAYDVLVKQASVDKAAIAVIGSSYGGYLATILSSLRPVRWLGLRVPALYKDEDWALPKQQLKKYGLAAYRRGFVSPDKNRALGACVQFEGDVLLVQSEHDDIIPPPVFANYRAAFKNVRSLTYRLIDGADHALSEEPWQQAYSTLLIKWMTEMVLGARETEATPAK